MELSPGQVTEYLEGGRFFPAACLGAKGSRFHLVNYLGREVNLSKSRLLYTGDQYLKAGTREELVRALSEIHERRERLKETVDLV